MSMHQKCIPASLYNARMAVSQSCYFNAFVMLRTNRTGLPLVLAVARIGFGFSTGHIMGHIMGRIMDRINLSTVVKSNSPKIIITHILYIVFFNNADKMCVIGTIFYKKVTVSVFANSLSSSISPSI